MAAKKTNGTQKTVSSSGAKKAAKVTAKSAATATKTNGTLKANVAKNASTVKTSSRGDKAAAVSAKPDVVASAKISKTAPSIAKKPKAKLSSTPASKPVSAKAVPKAATKTAVKAVANKSPRSALPKSAKSPRPPTLDAQANVSSSINGASLQVGDQVPAFEALNQDGEKIKSSDWAGTPYVLYFYPKDDTPGCTTEACGFRDELPAFNELGVKVVGCSPDSPSAHTRFAKKYGLQFTLLSDLEKDLAQLFGVWKLKQNYGREYMGVERSTFLIDKEGKMARAWRGVRVAGHVTEVLQAVRDLG